MSSTVVSQSEGTEAESSRAGPEAEHEEAGSGRRKLWRTLDDAAPLKDVDRDGNLYAVVRRNLHKVDRVPGSCLSPLKSPGTGNRSGVSQETSIGRFSTIKALFDEDVGQVEAGRMRFRCRTTVMGRLIRMLGARKRDLFADQPITKESTETGNLNINSNVRSK